MKHDEMWTIFTGISDRMQSTKFHTCMTVPHEIYDNIPLANNFNGTHFPAAPISTLKYVTYRKVECNGMVEVVYECDNHSEHAHTPYERKV